jgi:protein TonB
MLKRDILLYAFLMLTLPSYAQIDTLKSKSDENAIFFLAEKMPEYPGGDEALNEYVSNTVKIPWAYVGDKIFVKVIVEKDGTCTAELMMGIGNERVDKDVVKAVSAISTWTPAQQNGITIRAQRTIGIKLARKK